MNKHASLFILLMLSLFAPFATVTGQRPPQTPAPDEDSDEVVRITSNLVQVDVVVTDQKGNQVTDLTAEDFEILEDDRPQKITNFSYVSNLTAPAEPVARPEPKEKNAPPVPPVRLRPEQVRRTIALVVDDLGLSFESAYSTRRALKKFVDEQMQPTDLVAIIRTGGGMGALQQFTSDKRQLYAAIERVRWNPSGRAGISAFAPIGRELDDNTSADGNDDSATSGASLRGLADQSEQFREELFTVGTLGALNYIIRGLRELPGRKSVLLITDGFALFDRANLGSSGGNDRGTAGYERRDRVIEALRRLIDLANRASVVIYTVDPRGLQVLGFSAEDNLAGMNPRQIEQALSDRRSDFFESQNGPEFLARQTGGFSIHNTNDLSAGVRRVLDDQKGFYLIGYRPDDATFDPKTGSRRFHNLKVKVRRAGFNVRTRSGFYGVENREARGVARTRAEQLAAALTSPFNSNGLDLRLTSLFGYDQKAGAFVRSILHIKGRDVTFTKEPDGWNKSVLDILIITFGDNGQVIDQISKTYTLRMGPDVYERALRDGFTYTVNLPVKKPGAYQLRAALRDAASERVGSASQFIEVPKVDKDRLMLSGIVMSGTGEGAKTKAPAAAATAATVSGSAATAPGADEATDTEDPEANPVVRRFKRGMVLEYNYLIFNARLDKAGMRPQLQTQVRIFREGRPIFTGASRPFDLNAQTDFKRLIAGGALRLGKDMTPGEYVLQILVTDLLAKGKNSTATQWIDFEITQ
ncbi:MAG TPA: VWA domain-containing protein [Pyrinomonadaceae bacterium]|jgi:VWFA-related protein